MHRCFRFLLPALLFAFVGLSSMPAQASTQILFGRDGKKATVLLLAVQQNPDAIALNAVLNVPVVEEQGKLTKKVLFTDRDGVKALSIVCAFSKVVSSTGSCVVTLNAADGMTFSPGSGKASYAISGTEATRLAQFFHAQANQPEIYRSSDGHLSVKAENETFHLLYE